MSVHFDNDRKTLCGKDTARVRYSVGADTSSIAYLADYWLSWGRDSVRPCKKCVDRLYEREGRYVKAWRGSLRTEAMT